MQVIQRPDRAITVGAGSLHEKALSQKLNSHCWKIIAFKTDKYINSITDILLSEDELQEYS